MPLTGPGRNFFGRYPGPRPIGPGAVAPAELAPLSNGFLQITLVRQPRTVGTKVRYKLSPPQASTQPPLVTGPIGVIALQVPRRPTHYKLSPPQVVTPLPPVVTRLRVSLSYQRPRVGTISTLGGPAVVTPAAPPAPVVTTLRVKLAPSARQGRWSGYGLAPPAIVDLPLAPPINVSLTLRKRDRGRTTFFLGAPGAISTTTTPPFAPVRVSLAQQKLNRRKITFKLRPPIVVNPAAPLATPTRVSLAQQKLNRASRRPKYNLHPPTVVDAATPTPTPTPTTPQWSPFFDQGGMYERDHGRRNFVRRDWDGK